MRTGVGLVAAIAGGLLGLVVLGGLVEAARPPAGAAGPAGPIRYDRDIRPILADRCFQCHGLDASKRQADLRLDTFEGATTPPKDSVAAIVPGKPEASELWARVNDDDPKDGMPPESSHKRRLSAEEKELVRRWIVEGAQYEPHWSFVAPTKPTPPSVRNESWVRNPIDRFVLARLEAEGIAPSPEADKPTLARRVFLDLTGLPPTPEELSAFEADTKPDAYERLVDRLLTEEPYLTRHAERMATPWMDQARYADTCGIHMDAGRQMWLWRDWVIQSYRHNQPFDRFVIEQLAGDLLPDATNDQKVASGFNRNHVTTDEGGAIAQEYLVEYAVDRVNTTGAVFLGLTLGCARCHDHKYDPVTQEDYYRLIAYFNSIEEPGLYSQEANPQRAFEPFIAVPTAEQAERIATLDADLARLRDEMERRTPEEEAARAAFAGEVLDKAGIRWSKAEVTEARSADGATLTVEADGSVRASGENPKQDEYTLTLRTDASSIRLLSLELLPDEMAGRRTPRIGRAPNGNAVVSGITIEAHAANDPSKTATAKPVWAWASRSQVNGDYDVSNLVLGPGRTWALRGHEIEGPVVGAFLLDQPIGFEGGTILTVRIAQRSIYDQHTLARLRLGVGSIAEAGLAMLPTEASRWYVAGPFPPDQEGRVYEATYGPEQSDHLDFAQNFGFGNEYWRFDQNLVDDRPVTFGNGRDITYLGRVVFAPTARTWPVSFGSDDGFALLVNGKTIASRTVDRSVAAGQEQVEIPLQAGLNTVVLKIVNTGGMAGYAWSSSDPSPLAGDIVAGILPSQMRKGDLDQRFEVAWRVQHLPRYREAKAALATTERALAEVNAAVPLTMVMKELPTPRETFVLTRGAYDKPDPKRPVGRGIPAALGSLPPESPPNRLGLAEWLVAAENPLVSRVTVNRLWELCFGSGLVRSSEDFGLQGEWPSHPELLDWLAVDFREHGWDQRRALREMVTSATYRQSSKVRPEWKDRDPENRLLSFYPRRRLSAEQLRDQALYVAGLLVEKTGGASVKPYQPEGLWQEVAMIQSNTRVYERGMGDDLWRRSLYTYWKRAAPPPSMLTFDAPTREFCTIRRTPTSTPLQALVLWNDEQFVEAARVLAQRTLASAGDDNARLGLLFRRCTGRWPEDRERELLSKALVAFRQRYAGDPAAASGVLSKGVAPRPPQSDAGELAAWTMVASGVLNLYETTTQE